MGTREIALKEVGSTKITLVKSRSGKTDVFDGIQGFYNEDYFNRMLSLERKRTQRSRKPFLMMLLDISKLVNPHPNLVVINGIGRVLDAGIRETDVRGWYRKGRVIGVLFTELESACGAVRDKIFAKLLLSMAAEIDRQDLEKIEVTFHAFPEDHDKGNGNGNGHFNMKLYKDLREGNRQNGLSRKVKRLMDIVGSLLALILFSPIILAVAAAVKFTSEGPVLFRQQRIGQWGETFTFLKFRSMQIRQAGNPHKAYIEKLIRENQSANGGTNGEPPVFKLTDDPRVTPVGRFIRKTSLDELPQLFNVLRGEMSLVGPRPPVPYEFEIYDVWHRMRMLTVKPGITGLWQVYGRSSTNFDEMVRLDLKYVTDWSLWQDIKIILQTPLAVIAGKGAY
jgi:lipopolysaccharide/colanic/teichoic acid biosynthesis glycosyltransferase